MHTLMLSQALLQLIEVHVTILCEATTNVLQTEVQVVLNHQ